ncbi:hypothetical protein E2C01_085069 [Portunus trituberculatus]|uniref:Uncharacterized protein n=1 Tax=Portunus trituberculatus TaxID=210409 RepID=A0A5B7J1M4_PORTR|nr:hypothetical protein [Portunus trituberculatus]
MQFHFNSLNLPLPVPSPPGKLLANGVEVMTELEKMVSRGRIFFIDELLFVDYDRVKKERERERERENTLTI